MNHELNGSTESNANSSIERQPTPRPSVRQTTKVKLLTTNRLVVAGVILISVLFGLALPFVPLKFSVVLIGIFPALLGGIFVIYKPFIGICAYYFYEYFRPDNFYPMLAPLRLAVVIESITLVAWIIHLIVKRQTVVWHKFNWVYLFFIGVIASTVITAANNRFAYDTFQAMLVTYVLFIVATNVVDSLKKLNWLVFTLIAVHFYYAIKGIQTGGLVGGALMGDENDLALAMNVFIPFAYFFLVAAKKFWHRLLYIVILMSLSFCTIVSLSRGGTVGLLAVVCYCIAKSKRRFLGFTAVLITGLIVLAFAPDKYWEDASTITDTSEATAQSRLNYWWSAVLMWSDYPVTGVGAANGPIRMPEYYRGQRRAAQEWGRTFHGTLPQILAELGTLGMGAYLMMLYMAGKLLLAMRKQKYRENEQTIHKLSDAILGGIIGFIVTGTFLSTGYFPQLWTMYMLTLVLYHTSKPYLNSMAEVKFLGAEINRTFQKGSLS